MHLLTLRIQHSPPCHSERCEESASDFAHPTTVRVGTAVLGCRNAFGPKHTNAQPHGWALPLKTRHLERKRHPATDASRRLHQVHRVPVLPHHRHVSLRQQIADVHDCIHVSGEEVGSGNWLPHEQI
jgi:hypothetical protein